MNAIEKGVRILIVKGNPFAQKAECVDGVAGRVIVVPLERFTCFIKASKQRSTVYKVYGDHKVNIGLELMKAQGLRAASAISISKVSVAF